MSCSISINSVTAAGQTGCTLFQCAEQMGLHVPSSCSQQGKCRECMVEVDEGMELLTQRVPEEAHLPDKFRLSCRARIAASGGTIRAHTLRRGAMQIEERRSNLCKMDRIDPCVSRDGHWVLLDGEPIDKRETPAHGLAIDLGTTTVVVALVNLEDGTLAAKTSFENPQRFAGSDVMARIQYDTQHAGKLLQRVLLGYLNRAIESLPIDPASIYEVIVAGNTTMRDLFFGLNVYSIGQKPYRSVTEQALRDGETFTSSISKRAKQLRIPICPAARIHGLPLVGGHVGADAAACLLAIDLAREERTIMMLDIGTNTELFIGNRHRLVAASCPAGPAFEGHAISCGMPGLEGAIERIRLDEQGRVTYSTIGGGTPLGICGSGLIDLLSELRRTGLMNEYGRFEGLEDPFVVDDRHGIVFRESDVNELAQAKAATIAGYQLAAKSYGIDLQDIDLFYLAGGFGAHVDIAAARRIGLIPNLPDSKIVQVGNASLDGAILALLSRSRRAELDAIAQRTTHLELETDPAFFDAFVSGCLFDSSTEAASPI